jgi:hypothetical protein
MLSVCTVGASGNGLANVNLATAIMLNMIITATLNLSEQKTTASNMSSSKLPNRTFDYRERVSDNLRALAPEED